MNIFEPSFKILRRQKLFVNNLALLFRVSLRTNKTDFLNTANIGRKT